MPDKKIYLAQKAVVFDKSETKILLNKYLYAKHTPKLNNKYGVPGGKMDFGERPEDTLVREVFEETGIKINPLIPFYTWTWVYKRNTETVQIVAVAWLATYRSGKIKKPERQIETDLAPAEWVELNSITKSKIIEDEYPLFQLLKKIRKKNPFII